jgi:urease accessory protein
MIQITQILAHRAEAQDALSLPYEQRRRSRLRARLDGGEEVGLFLPRGTALREGDLLLADNGWVVRVRAAPETVSRARCADPVALARAAYHLGNRHVALQIEEDSVRYLHDHVLDEMLHAMGLAVTLETLPFEPEVGAYGGHSHAHEHEHGDDEEARTLGHSHGHSHSDGHSHGRGHRH